MKDSLGRKNNRKLIDKTCPVCGCVFRPRSKKSKYCSRPCMWSKNGGHNKKKESWWTNNRGYVEGRVWVDDCTQIRVKQHRYIMSQYLGRQLDDCEDVHHVDGNRSNNHIDNLELVLHGEHTRITNSQRVYRSGYKIKLSSQDKERKKR
jgi:uncharacterized C2H2 Zn-finger protein